MNVRHDIEVHVGFVGLIFGKPVYPVPCASPIVRAHEPTLEFDNQLAV